MKGPRDDLLRPEQIEIAEAGSLATVVRREFHGHDWLYVLRLESGTELRTISPSMTPLFVGASVRVRPRVAEVTSFLRD